MTQHVIDNNLPERKAMKAVGTGHRCEKTAQKVSPLPRVDFLSYEGGRLQTGGKEKWRHLKSERPEGLAGEVKREEVDCDREPRAEGETSRETLETLETLETPTGQKTPSNKLLPWTLSSRSSVTQRG
ncbi:hypothetical protein EYF80_057205 [Liparis tanakae]|uniref:Uncharacterized protein n=1 Tax=Liparis tanakae TaxID=230148 RepID=A0A4Z2EVF5_9TELE|nr:hypothetical protein EYF80_057205 [Liparis tanakae]